jgi:hypothetical protein
MIVLEVRSFIYHLGTLCAFFILVNIKDVSLFRLISNVLMSIAIALYFVKLLWTDLADDAQAKKKDLAQVEEKYRDAADLLSMLRDGLDTMPQGQFRILFFLVNSL